MAPLITYVLALASTTALSLGLTPLALGYARRRGVLDHPGGHKSHTEAVPYLGGAALVVSFALVVLVLGALARPTEGYVELSAILGLGVVLAVMGLWDDLRGLPVAVRLLAQLGAATLLWASGVGVVLLDVPALDLALTVLWVVGITNAFNLLDNMDGLSAGVAAIAGTWLFLIAALNGQFLVAALCAALVGCTLGFLRHNVHPARIYMGDAGSLFLGFVLAALAVKLRFEAPRNVTFLTPIMVLAVPIFDTALVVVTRLRHGRGVFTAGRDHTSHRLVRLGLSVPVAVGVIYGAAASAGWLGLAVSRSGPTTAYLLAGLLTVQGVVAAVALSRVEVDPPGDRAPS